ncbi:ASIC2 protein, partial [Polyodon spathula]|nr:ASIC2 protein [Polyodon spathula]
MDLKQTPSEGSVGSFQPTNIQVFAGSSTFHGIRHIFVYGPMTIRRLFWMMAFIISLGLLVVESAERVVYFFSYPHVTKVDEVVSNSLVFPAVTICNLNQYRFSKLSRNDLYHAGELLALLNVHMEIPDPHLAEPEVLAILKEKAYFENYKPKPFSMPEFMGRVGHDLKEMMLSCKFKGKVCTHQDFKVTFLDSLGIALLSQDQSLSPAPADELHPVGTRRSGSTARRLELNYLYRDAVLLIRPSSALDNRDHQLTLDERLSNCKAIHDQQQLALVREVLGSRPPSACVWIASPCLMRLLSGAGITRLVSEVDAGTLACTHRTAAWSGPSADPLHFQKAAICFQLSFHFGAASSHVEEIKQGNLQQSVLQSDPQCHHFWNPFNNQQSLLQCCNREKGEEQLPSPEPASQSQAEQQPLHLLLRGARHKPAARLEYLMAGVPHTTASVAITSVTIARVARVVTAGVLSLRHS